MIGLLLHLIPGFSTLVALVQLVVGVVYPTLMSFKAIESTGSKDDTQWLTYWVVFSVFTVLEKPAWVVLRWVPLYGLLKIAGLAWLTMPQFQGAKFVYTTYARPFLSAVVEKAKEIPSLEPYVRDIPSGGRPAILKKAEDALDDAASALAPKPVTTEKTGVAPLEETFAPLKAHAQ